MSYCSSKLLDDANRREVCASIADVLVDRSSTLLAAGLGHSLLKRVGAPAARLQAVNDLSDAWHATAGGLRDIAALDCRSVERNLDQIRDMVDLGEQALARRAVEKSGKSIEELALAWRAARAKVAAAAAERAASGIDGQTVASAPKVAAR